MATAESMMRLEQARRLEQLLERHRDEVALLRDELGDPRESLFTFVRDRFDFLSFFPDVRQNSRGIEWDDDDDLDAW